jgi:hypothetical protein
VSEPLRLKFAIQSPDATLSGAVDTIVDQISTEWVRFMVPAALLEGMVALPMDAPSPENQILMFIYLPLSQTPIRSIGQISWCEKSPQDCEEAYSVVVDFREIGAEDMERIENHLRDQALMGDSAEARTGKVRRASDAFFQEIAHMLEVLSRLSEGKREEFGEQFANLVGVKNTLGRRLEDKKLGDEICFHLERIASNVAQMVSGKAGLRRVRIRKVIGKEEATVAKDKVFVGWEEAPPQVNRSYCLYIEGGGIFRSATITNVLKDHFRTRNSLYEIQEL